jgi:hypothetical protein
MAREALANDRADLHDRGREADTRTSYRPLSEGQGRDSRLKTPQWSQDVAGVAGKSSSQFRQTEPSLEENVTMNTFNTVREVLTSGMLCLDMGQHLEL